MTIMFRPILEHTAGILDNMVIPQPISTIGIPSTDSLYAICARAEPGWPGLDFGPHLDPRHAKWSREDGRFEEG